MAAEELKRCVIICASPDWDKGFLKSFVRDDDYIICADGGCRYALDAGIVPDLAVGDFDSFEGKLPENVETLTLSTRKDYSDTHVAADKALGRGYKNIVLIFAAGGRLDHTLSNICVLSHIINSGGFAYIASKTERVYLCRAGETTVSDCENRTFSIVAYNCGEAVVSCFGDVDYPVNALKFSSDVSLGLSNYSRGESLTVDVIRGEVLLIIND